MNAPKPSRTVTFTRVVLPFALIPPLMIVFAMRSHPEAYRLSAASANWEWIASMIFVAELVSVEIVAGMLRLTTPAGGTDLTPEQAYALAAHAASPLWSSAVVLAIPSLAALVVVQVLAHLVSVRALYRQLRVQLRIDADIEALHITYMAYSVPLVLWIPFLAMIFVSILHF